MSKAKDVFAKIPCIAKIAWKVITRILCIGIIAFIAFIIIMAAIWESAPKPTMETYRLNKSEVVVQSYFRSNEGVGNISYEYYKCVSGERPLLIGEGSFTAKSNNAYKIPINADATFMEIKCSNNSFTNQRSSDKTVIPLNYEKTMVISTGTNDDYIKVIFY